MSGGYSSFRGMEAACWMYFFSEWPQDLWRCARRPVQTSSSAMMERATMEPTTAATATPLRWDAAISTEKSASLVVTFTQEMWMGEEKGGEVAGLGEELGAVEVGVATGREDEMARQRRYWVAGSKWVKLYS